MKQNKKVTKLLLFLYGLCAVIWTANVILRLAFGAVALDIALSLLCAVIWIFLLIVTIRRYRIQQNSDEGGTN